MDNQEQEQGQEQFPFIEDLECAFLSAFLMDRKLWVRMYTEIKPHYFRNSNNSKIFQIMRVYFNKYKEFPTETQMLNFVERKNYDESVAKQIKEVFKTTKSLEPHMMKYFHDECGAFIKDRMVIDSFLESAELYKQRKYNEMLESMKKAVSWTAEVQLGTQPKDAVERYNELEKMYESSVSWPWARLQQSLHCGLLKKHLYVVVGASSVGKSILLDNVAFDAWHKQQKNVVSISLEIPEIKKCQRMDAYGLKIPQNELINRKDEVFNFYEDNQTEKRLYVKEFPTRKASVEKEITNYLMNLELHAGLHKDDIDLIIIDYGDILKPLHFTGNMYNDVGSCFEAMRALATEYDCPVLTAGQLSREVAKNDMSVDDVNEGFVGESQKKYNIADFLMAAINTVQERANGIINFKVMKDREGSKDLIIPMKIDYPSLRIYDPADK